MSFSQKIIKKSIVNAAISHIQIDVNNCFELDLATYDGDELIVEAKIDGEYENNLSLNIVEKGATLIINAGFHPNFINPNDKLSAHKVISIALQVLLPQQKKVHVFGTYCNVTASGDYNKLNVSLNDGKCNINNVTQMVEVATQSGQISATYSKATINATSKYGKVTGPISTKGNNYYKLNTVTGDIVLKKME